MSARRIARELAVIIFPQLPKSKEKLAQLEFDALVVRAVGILADHAKQCLSEATAFLERADNSLTEIEVEHPNNARAINVVLPVPLTSQQLKDQVSLLKRAVQLVEEALDMPELVAGGIIESSTKGNNKAQEAKAFLFNLISAYVAHQDEVNECIRQVKAKWKIERMVSVDRDILRLACTEILFMPEIPVQVSINEAVELAHCFADEAAAKFLNGVLGDLADHAKDIQGTTWK